MHHIACVAELFSLIWDYLEENAQGPSGRSLYVWC